MNSVMQMDNTIKLAKRCLSVMALVKNPFIRGLEISICYLVISIFDLLGISFLVIFASELLGDGDWIFSNFGIEFSQKFLLLSLPCIYVIKFFAVIFANYMIIRYTQSVGLALRVKYAEAFFDEPHPEKIINERGIWEDTVNRQITYLSTGVLEPFLRGCFDLALIVAILAYMAFLAPVLVGGLLIFFIGSTVLFDAVIKRKIQSSSYSFNLYSENLSNEITNLSVGFSEFWAIRSKRYFLNRLMIVAKKIAQSYAIFSVSASSPRLFLETTIVIATCLSIGVANALGHSDEGILLSLTVVGVGAVRLIPLINSVNLGLNQLRTGSRVLEKIALKESRDAVQASNNSCTDFDELRVFDLSKRIDGVSRIEKLGFSIQKGEALIIHGPSGCGKTTLVESLIGLRSVDGGSIRFRQKKTGVSSVKTDQIVAGYVSQHPAIVSGTVLENIVLQNPDSLIIDNEKLNKCLNLSGFGKVLGSLPDGLDTLIDPKERPLSGGQKTKLAICRALFASPQLLVFDEPTSAFDKVSEIEFFENLAKIKKQAVVIVVTHSTEFLGVFDLSLKIENGTIISG